MASNQGGAADAIVVGGGLAGLVAAAELADAGRRVIVVDQEPEASLGGQAFWSLGALMMVDTPEQRRMRIRDSRELALQDWLGTAAFDRPEDEWPRRWAEAYVDFAAGEMRPWLRGQGMRWLPIPGWPERGGYHGTGHGNSVPRFHIAWGTGPGVLEPFVRRVRVAQERGVVELRFRHRVDELITSGDAVTGVRGKLLEPSPVARGEASSRVEVGDFELDAEAVIVTSGGIGANHDLIRANWPTERLGESPKRMLCGVPAHVDGRMLAISESAGASIINRDRMWHYTEGVRNWSPIWPNHAIRIIPGPSSLWLDATGRRLPPPLFPGFDTMSTVAHIGRTGHDYTWFVLNQRIVEREFALSGSEQNPDITGRSLRAVAQSRFGKGATPPVEAFKQRGADFAVADDLDELVRRMNAIADDGLQLDPATVRAEIEARDRAVDNRFAKDLQVQVIREQRRYLPDRLVRVAAPHRLLDPKAGPLIAVRLWIMSRKTLGGLHTDLDARVLTSAGDPLPGLYAAGEVAGFGGGGMHGYGALEGTFLGGCIFSGRTAGRAAAGALAGPRSAAAPA
jgi:uncharacterized protein